MKYNESNKGSMISKITNTQNIIKRNHLIKMNDKVLPNSSHTVKVKYLV